MARIKRCRLVADGTLGTILESDSSTGWMTIMWDGAPCPVDVWWPLTRGLVVRCDAEVVS